MADTIREQILAALATRLGADRVPLDELLETIVTFPVTVLNAGGDAVERTQYGSVHVVMPVTVDRVNQLADGANSSVQSNVMLGNLIQEATGIDRTLGGLAEDLQYAEGAELTRESGSNLAGARATFNIRYHFVIGDPFTTI